MIHWKKARIWLLILFCGSALLVLAKVILLPIPDKPKLDGFVFPQDVPLSQWKLTTSRALPKPNIEALQVISLWNYQYTQKSQTLNIEMRYLTDNADVFALLRSFYKASSPPKVRQQEGIGKYGLGIDQNQRAYLSACINPRGGSTITQGEFTLNRYLYDVRPDRLVNLMLGKELLLDKRCVWVYLSIPLNGSSPEAAYEVLENAWFDWYKWWQPNFPKAGA